MVVFYNKRSCLAVISAELCRRFATSTALVTEQKIVKLEPASTEMKGSVLSFNRATYRGIISGYDGRQYDFVMLDWQSPGFPTAGAAVEFTPNELQATNILSSANNRMRANLLSYWFSATGRTSRMDYWTRYLLPVFGAFIVASVLDQALLASREGARSAQPFVSLTYLFFLFPSFAVPIKRLHDRGLSGWWIVPGQGLLLTLPVAAYWYYSTRVNASEAAPDGLMTLLGWTALGVLALAWLFVLVNLWFLRGQPFENRYGPDPLEHGADAPLRRPVVIEDSRSSSHEPLAPSPTSDTKRSALLYVPNWIGRHWQGTLPLWVSYWIVGVVGNLIAFGLVFLVTDTMTPDGDFEPVPIFVALVISWSIVVCVGIWQLVGIWRSASRYIRENAERDQPTFWGGAAKVAVVLGAVSLFAQIANAAAPQIKEVYRIAFLNDPDLPAYSLRLTRNGTELELVGGFKYGLDGDLQSVLAAAPDVRVLHLDSVGGRIGEAVKVAKTVGRHRLVTYVAANCLSACTVAFAGGVERKILPGAKLGFHASAFPGMSQEDTAEADDTQRRVFVASGISGEFVDRALSTRADQMWFPTQPELQEAGVITGVATISEFAFSGIGGHVSEDAIAAKITPVLPFLTTLQRVSPTEYNAVLAVFVQSYKKGDTVADMVVAARKMILPTIVSRLPLADDSTVRAYGQLLVDQYKELRSRDVAQCFRFASGVGWDVNQPLVFSPQLARRELGLYDEILVTARLRHSPDPTTTEALWLEIFQRMSSRVGSERVMVLAETNVEPSRYRDYCDAAIALYQEVLQAPPATSAILLRQNFEQLVSNKKSNP